MSNRKSEERAREVWEGAHGAYKDWKPDGKNHFKEAAIAFLASALEQAYRQGTAGEYRRGVEAIRDAALIDCRRFVTELGELGQVSREIKADSASLLSALEAGDRYRETREAFVAGVKWRHGKTKGWSLVQEYAEHEALRRWPLSEPAREKT